MFVNIVREQMFVDIVQVNPKVVTHPSLGSADVALLGVDNGPGCSANELIIQHLCMRLMRKWLGMANVGCRGAVSFCMALAVRAAMELGASLHSWQAFRSRQPASSVKRILEKGLSQAESAWEEDRINRRY